MASYTKLTRQELRELCERELMDTSNLWWTDAELNNYLDDWQKRVQREHLLIWGSSTQTATGTSTFTLSDFASDIMRPGRLVWNGITLIPKTEQELQALDPLWRLRNVTTSPTVVFQENLDTITVWPPVSGSATSTVSLEYPKEPSFAGDATPMILPAYVKPSAKNYVGFRSFLRRGPNFNNQKAGLYKDKFYSDLELYGIIKRRSFPAHFYTLKPGGSYEKRLSDPVGEVIPSPTDPGNIFTMIRFNDETPAGTVNGTNTAFTLTYTPEPVASLELNLDGIEMIQGTHYTLSSSTITFVTGAPLTGQTLFAHYRYVV